MAGRTHGWKRTSIPGSDAKGTEESACSFTWRGVSPIISETLYPIGCGVSASREAPSVPRKRRKGTAACSLVRGFCPNGANLSS